MRTFIFSFFKVGRISVEFWQTLCIRILHSSARRCKWLSGLCSPIPLTASRQRCRMSLDTQNLSVIPMWMQQELTIHRTSTSFVFRVINLMNILNHRMNLASRQNRVKTEQDSFRTHRSIGSDPGEIYWATSLLDANARIHTNFAGQRDRSEGTQHTNDSERDRISLKHTLCL